MRWAIWGGVGFFVVGGILGEFLTWLKHRRIDKRQGL